MKFMRFITIGLIVGALFGWAMSTKLSTRSSVAGGVAASAFMFVGMVYNDHLERRELVRRSDEGDEKRTT